MCGIVGYVGRGHARAWTCSSTGSGVSSTAATTRRASRSSTAARSTSAARSASSRTSRRSLRDSPLGGRIGIGHTRWATHGKPSERNAHPHRAGGVVVVHNGIIENYRELRAELEAAGRTIASDTDTELIAHLIDDRARGGQATCVTAVARGLRAPRRLLRLRVLSTNDAGPHRRREERRQPDRARVSARSRHSSRATSRRSCPTRARWCSSRTASSPCCRKTARRSLDAAGRPIDREPQADPVGSGLGGEGRLRPLHAEGDLRAAARDHRHDRHARASRPRPTSISTGSTCSRKSA